jgi:WXG100 family type VII secretion target
MPASTVRAEYQALSRIAQSFAQQADATRQMLKELQNKLSVLQAGDWQGRGATIFYQEMHSQVLPAFGRLLNAQLEGSRIADEIIRVMKEAEDEAAKVLRGERGSPVDAAFNAAAAVLLTSEMEEVARMAVGADAGTTLGGAPAAGAVAGMPPPGTAVRAAAAVAATERMLSQFDAKVREYAEKSPTLMSQLEELERQGWTIERKLPDNYLQPAKQPGTVTQRPHIDIGVTPWVSAENQVGSIAHEVAHALYQKPYHEPIDLRRTPTNMTAEDADLWAQVRMPEDFTPLSGLDINLDDTLTSYVRANVWEDLRAEGNATLNEATVRDEVRRADGPPNIMAGMKANYVDIYDTYRSGAITRDQAVDQIAEYYGPNEHPSNAPALNYQQYYSLGYVYSWLFK